MKEILMTAFLLVSLIGSPLPAHSADFDSYVEGAEYLEEYQAKQRRNDLMLKGLLALLLAAGGIAVAVKTRKKGDKPQ